ncbi:MAG: cache domain-containing protein, partial [Shewanella sp.]
MITFLRQFTILQRLMMMLMLAAIGTVCFASFSIKEQYDNLISQKWLQIDGQLTSIVSVIEVFHKNALSQDPSQAQQAASALSSQTRYGNQGYFIVIDDANQILAHGDKPELIGTSALAFSFADGSNPFATLLPL